MFVGSSVSVAWGIQIQTIPLLLALGAYEASEPARLFFSLLRLRASSSTLLFTPPSRRTTIASLPVEVVEYILAYLHLNLLPEARAALVGVVRDCHVFCTDTGHVCGIDCRFTNRCCNNEDDEEDYDFNRSRSFETDLLTKYRPKIHRFLALFGLDVIAAPKVSEDYDLRFFGCTLDTIVGIPFKDVRTLSSSPPPPPPSPPSLYPSSLSEIEPRTVKYNSTRVLSLQDPIQGLTTEERARFRRFVRLLHLVEDDRTRRIRKEGVGSPVEGDEWSEDKGLYKRTEPALGDEDEYPLDSGTTMLEPKLLVVHASWAFAHVLG